jgi:hypothetical protein
VFAVGCWLRICASINYTFEPGLNSMKACQLAL